ncbi:MAG: flagellar hook-length control protein FliK [Spirochaetales bacterium]|nr:flagellar hook-length control protein FliK [Spirochaetales bacterium]
MTAVKGRDMFPVKENVSDSNHDVKKKGESSPFDKLMAREEASPPDRDEPDRSMEPAMNDEPVRSKSYSAKKVAALLHGMNEGTPGGKRIKTDLEAAKKISLGEGLGNGLSEGNILPVGLSLPQDDDEALQLISHFLEGDISAEEMDQLAGLEKDRMGDFLTLSSEEAIKEFLADEDESDGEGTVLKGFLSDEGELVYFDKVSSEGEGKLLSSIQKGALGKIDGESKNQVQIEINVTDLRTAKGEESTDFDAVLREGDLSEVDLNVRGEGDASDQLDIDLGDDLLATPGEKLISAEGAGGKLEAPVSKEVSRLFQDYMNETGNKELVRKIDFILKDENQGEIKLILKPEALGNVRINLSLNENHIAGKIFVDNSSVRDIFLNNMDELTSLLKENGYEEASLEVWVGQDGRSGQEQEQNEERGEEKRLRSVKGLKTLEESVPHTASAVTSGSGQINLVI